MRFQDRVVWITGASSGIGEALAYAFSRAGAKLILSARRADALENVRQHCAIPENIVVLPLDLADLESLPQKANEARAAFGAGVDILVNNGGVGQRGRAVQTPIAVDQKIMQVNYFGHVALTKAVLPAMIERKSGHIVVISSISGKVGAPKRSAYSASKHALHGFFDSLRAEVHQHNIKVTLICPGFVKTKIAYNALRADGTPRGRDDSQHFKAMSAEKCAAETLKAIAKGKDEVYISAGLEILGVYLSRLSPSLLRRVVRRFETPE
jgi:short-subunit dehydrogenase